MLRALRLLLGLGRRRRRVNRAYDESQLTFELDPPRKPRATERTHRDDEVMTEELRRAHEQLDRERFGGSLTRIPIRVSRRMKSRLGHYTHRDPSGEGGEIVISRRHIRRHGWDEAIETLIHEMVHQWQDENRLPVDHGRQFRAKARLVGISPRARR
ncbi:MAG: SprT-like domain-containing protein, partial [Gemmatimonadaceae bacterium]